MPSQRLQEMKRLSLTNKTEPKRKVRFQRHLMSQHCCLPESLLSVSNGSIWRYSALTPPSYVPGRDSIHIMLIWALDITWILRISILPQIFTFSDLYKYKQRPTLSPSYIPISPSPHWQENSIQYFVGFWISLKDQWSLPWSSPNTSPWLPCEHSTIQTLKPDLLQAGNGARRSPGVPSNLHLPLWSMN